jgi:colanic acid/amylovoran biosynthesis protein
VRSWLHGDAQGAYEKAVAKSLDTIIADSNAHVIFIPQVTAAKSDDDRIVSQRVVHLMHNTQHTSLIDDEPDHHRIKAIYEGLDVLLGTRFHSVIFSLTSYVPVVAIEYEHKTSGIMRDLKLEGWVVKIEDATEQTLTRQLKRLIHNQESYQRHLKSQLPSYLKQARQTIELLKQAITPVA